MATLSSVNPATGEVLARFDELSDPEVEARIARAAQTFRTWRRRPFAERAALMARAADVLEQRKEQWGRIMTLEMGKTFKSAVAEAEKCAWACRFYAESAERFLADEEGLEAALREARLPEDLLDGEGALRDVGGVLEEPHIARHEPGRGEA